MNGHITKSGVILGDDGRRYTFGAKDVKNLGNHRSDDIVGMHVNFTSHENRASEIFLVRTSGAHEASINGVTPQNIRERELKEIKKLGLLAAFVWLLTDLFVVKDTAFKRFLLDVTLDRIFVDVVVLVLAILVCVFLYKLSKRIDKFAGSKLAQDMRISVNAMITFIIFSDLAVFLYGSVFQENMTLRDAGILKLAALVVLSLFATLCAALSSWYYFKWNKEMVVMSKDGLFMLAFVCGLVSLFFIFAPQSVVGDEYKFIGEIINTLSPLCLLLAFVKLKHIGRMSEK